MLALTFAATVHIGVLGAFHPTQFELRPALGATLIVESEGRTSVLKNGATFHVSGPATVTGRFGLPSHFFLTVPGHAEREYFGRLDIRQGFGRQLLAIVEMDLETAVASIVDAEGTKGLPFEARRAQAVATRSYLLAAAGKRHMEYDFCDQDHCQFMRDVSPENSPAAKAANSTRGQVLVYKGSVVAALYSANCGGHTRNLFDAGWALDTSSATKYPYYGVSCPLGGTVSGHRVGMCQLGAIQIARQGKAANVILGHYFPGTKIGVVGGSEAGAAALARRTTTAGKDVRAAR